MKGKATVLLVRDVERSLAYYRDVPALHEELRERGAELLHGPEERPWTSSEIRVRDPDGYVLAFGQLAD